MNQRISRFYHGLRIFRAGFLQGRINHLIACITVAVVQFNFRQADFIQHVGGFGFQAQVKNDFG
jgi:hypothetical protein